MSTHSEQSSHHRVSTFLLALLLILAAMLLMGQSAVSPNGDAVDGKEVFERVCATCHTVQPPANLAPPMAMIVRHYGMALPDSAAVKDALVAWIGGPDSSKSLLPAHAIERFGLMAPVDLTKEEIDAVANYVMTLKADMPGGAIMGRGMMQNDRMGQGMMGNGGGMMQHGMMGQGRGMMMQTDSTGAMTCPRMQSASGTMNCPRMDGAAATVCPQMDGTAATPCPCMDAASGAMKCPRMESASGTAGGSPAGQACRMRN